MRKTTTEVRSRRDVINTYIIIITNVNLPQASKHRLFNMQNDWILITSRRLDENRGRNTSAIALETFEVHLNEAYVLPESNVFLFVATVGGWEIWEGFKVGMIERIQVHRLGTVTDNGLDLEKNHSVSFRSDLRGITLKATTVVSGRSESAFRVRNLSIESNQSKL